MLIIGERSGETNILHVIIGPETIMQFNMQGHSSIDISDYIAQYQTGEKCSIVVTRCDSEDDVIGMLEMQKQRSAVMDAMKKVTETVTNKETYPAPEKEHHSKKSDSHGIRCPICLRANAAVIKDGMVFACETCQKIDAGLTDKKVPPLPSIDALDEMRKKVENDHPQQKKSIFKFYKKEEKKDKKRGKNDTSDI